MALKIVYKICCGIDVHKTFVVACIASTDSKGVTTYEHHRFSTYTKGLKDLLQWLLKHNCKDVCMESTGKYWIPVAPDRKFPAGMPQSRLPSQRPWQG